MKKLLYVGLALLTFALHGCGPTSIVVESTPASPPPPPPVPEVSYQSFYDALSPYGQWINNPDYGYVWMPSVAPDFSPYGSNGHWVYTDEGWTWDSDYPWGWAAFHYGRWFFEDGYGWMWIPGNEWAPAWVSWRQSPDYYGWAPLGPQVTISASFGGGYNPPPQYWHFVPQQYVARPQVNNYFVSEQQNVTIVRNTTIIRNTTINNTTIVNNNYGGNRGGRNNNYAGGPDPAEVSRVSGAPLRPIPLRESNRPGERADGGALSIYRPRINQPSPSGSGGSSAPAPSRVQPLNQVRPVNSNSYNNPRPAGNPSSNINPGNPNNPANPNPNGNPNNAGYPRNGGNANNAGNPANPGHPAGAGNAGAPRAVNNPATSPVNSTPGNAAPGNTAPGNAAPGNTAPGHVAPGNTPPANHPITARPGYGNPQQVRLQPGGRPQPTVNQPPANNHPAPPKTTTPVTRPLNQSPAGNRPKKDDKDNKDNKPGPTR